jgi:CO/xanthine dehydrogenase Mo-binding subunit
MASLEGNGDLVGGLPYPRRLRPWPRCLHEHGANSALPKRRPAGGHFCHRATDRSGRRSALDPAALRQRNLIPSAAQPYTNPLGLTYDSGDYEQVMERALAHADWQGFAARRAEARRRGRWRGIGIANFVEITTGAPRERTEITVLPDGKVRHHSVQATCSSLRGFAADPSCRSPD